MASIEKLEKLVSGIPTPMVEKLTEYVRKNDPNSISATTLKDLRFTQTESITIRDAIKDIKDGPLLAAYLNLLSKINEQKKSTDTKLVISGDFVNANADYTHETIYQMVNRAESEITIIGYWMYEIQDLLGELSKLQKEKGLRIRFIMDSAKKWRRQILRHWNEERRPEIFEPSPDHVKSLHAKIIIIDRSEVLVTSANLTTNAMEDNIEAGIWTTKSNMVESCLDVFDEFEQNGSIIRSKNRI